MTYPHRIVGRDVAEYAAEHGGASFHFQTGKPVPAPGFMVGRDGSEEHTDSGDSPTPAEAQAYADKHAPSVANDPEAAHGIWGDTQDVSHRVDTGQKMRIAARKNRQEATFALGSDKGPPTRINSTIVQGKHAPGYGSPMTTDSIWRPKGAEVLTNLQASGDAKGTRAFISMMDNESDSGRHPTSRLFAPTGNLNDISLIEIDNDAWDYTNKNNRLGASGRGPTDRADGKHKRIDLGDVLRTINYGRTQSARGINMKAHPEKGWHEDTNAQGEKVNPRKKRKNDDDGERSVVEHSPALEAERGGFPAEATRAELAEQQYQAAADLHRRLAPPPTPDTPWVSLAPDWYVHRPANKARHEATRQMVQKHFG